MNSTMSIFFLPHLIQEEKLCILVDFLFFYFFFTKRALFLQIFNLTLAWTLAIKKNFCYGAIAQILHI